MHCLQSRAGQVSRLRAQYRGQGSTDETHQRLSYYCLIQPPPGCGDGCVQHPNRPSDFRRSISSLVGGPLGSAAHPCGRWCLRAMVLMTFFVVGELRWDAWRRSNCRAWCANDRAALRAVRPARPPLGQAATRRVETWDQPVGRERLVLRATAFWQPSFSDAGSCSCCNQAEMSGFLQSRIVTAVRYSDLFYRPLFDPPEARSKIIGTPFVPTGSTGYGAQGRSRDARQRAAERFIP